MDREAKFLEFIQNGEEPFMYERDILFDHWERVKEVMAGRNTNPYEIELQPTNRCNLHCTHCVGVAHKPKDVIEISPERMKEIIKKIHKRGGVKRVKFSGYYGEPLMNSKSVLIGIREAKKKGMKVGLFTNGTLLNEGIMSAIMGIEYVNISLDAGSRESYQKLKGSDQFNRVISNIRMLDALRKSRKSRLEITVGYILNRDNYREIPQMVKTLKNHIDILRFKANILNSDMTKEELDEAYRFIGESKEHETKGFRIISIPRTP